jgi:hypothetical protein
MIEYCVVSKSRMERIYCDGPLTAQVEKTKLEGLMRAAGYPLDVEIELRTKPRPLARASANRKRSTKLRYK